MATAREIRSKIGSVKNTQKITRAMEMVAASKMRKAQDRMKASRPYAERIREVIKHLAKAHPEYHHPYLQNRTVKRVGFIIVTSDRGLCGGLNINLLKTSILTIREFTKQEIEVDLALIGHKADNFFRRVGGNVTAKTEHIGDAPLLKNIIGSVKVMLDAYNAGNIDALYVCSNQFVTTMIQRPKVLPLLPITKLQEEEESKQYWDYIYEPDARELLDKLLERYIESQVYQAVIENIACEQAARMLAMKNATDNAGEIITELRLAYNKARQAAITKEISEIVGGAAAV